MATDPLAPLLDLPGVSDAVAETRTAVDTVLTHRALRRRSADVSAESSLRGAWISAAAAGSAATLEDVRSGAAVDDPLVQGALRAYAALPSLTDTWSKAPRQVLARVQTLAAADLVPDRDVLGRPSAGADRLDVLAGVLATTQAPAVVVAAIVLGEVLALDAFAPASGTVARVAVRLTLIERGLDPKSLVVVEAGLREVELDSALDAYRAGSPDGLAQWIRTVCAAVIAGARETTAICEAMTR